MKADSKAMRLIANLLNQVQDGRVTL